MNRKIIKILALIAIAITSAIIMVYYYEEGDIYASIWMTICTIIMVIFIISFIFFESSSKSRKVENFERIKEKFSLKEGELTEVILNSSKFLYIDRLCLIIKEESGVEIKFKASFNNEKKIFITPVYDGIDLKPVELENFRMLDDQFIPFKEE